MAFLQQPENTQHRTPNAEVRRFLPIHNYILALLPCFLILIGVRVFKNIPAFKAQKNSIST
jgi:hypothetical protein